MSRTRVAVLTATIIRGQTYLKVLRKGIAFSLHIILKKKCLRFFARFRNRAQKGRCKPCPEWRSEE